MSNALNLLMSCNQEALKKPTKQIEIPRLTEALGEKFEVTVQAINMGQFKTIIRDSGLTEEDPTSAFEMQMLSVKLGMIDPKVTDKNLQKQLNAQNWEELTNKLFLMGEIATISEAVMELSEMDTKKKTTKKK